MGKLDLNKKAKEDSLLATAYRLFTTKGVSKTSISDIVQSAGVAKGTFYLYFKDKYDLRNRLVAHHSSKLFRTALEKLQSEERSFTFNEKIIFIIDTILGELEGNKPLVTFISKNLSWGVFKHALTSPVRGDDVNFMSIYEEIIRDAPGELDQPEVMLFMIIELVSSTCYSAILYSEPVELEQLKPYLYRCVNNIIDSHCIKA